MNISSFWKSNKQIQVNDFDHDYYLHIYPDVVDRTKHGAIKHYMRYGHKEGRFRNPQDHVLALQKTVGPLPADFDEVSYLTLNPDVREQYNFVRGASIHYLTFGRAEGRVYKQRPPNKYDENLLNLMLNRIFDMPDVVVDLTAQVRVNVLVPAFDFKSMSAGFFGVFQIARFIKSCGFEVRLVLFDNFYWSYDEFCDKLSGYPGMERLPDEIEIEYIGERLAPLVVSPNDRVVATVWYSAYFAEKIMKAINPQTPFLYLIQDYETNFFPGSSLFSLADRTYSMNFYALISTEILLKSFKNRKIGAFRKRNIRALPFNNACSAYLPSKIDFISKDRSRRRLAFYSRPEVNRNMFELGALALCNAARLGVFGDEWDFYGVGMGSVEIELKKNTFLKQLPRMNLKDYSEVISTFDIGLCLMASPHPSLLPFDLAGSGAIVLTNSFDMKNQDYFLTLSSNIICREPCLDTLVSGLKEAVEKSYDLELRYFNAKNMNFPRKWEDCFDNNHFYFINEWAGNEKKSLSAKIFHFFEL